jgi:hypothetical protein
MVNESLNHRTMDKERRSNLKTTNPSHKKGRVMGSRRRTLESGVISTKSLGTKLMNVARNNHCWMSLNKKSQTPTQTLIQSRIREQIIDAEPSATITTAKIQPEDS